MKDISDYTNEGIPLQTVSKELSKRLDIVEAMEDSPKKELLLKIFADAETKILNILNK